MTGGGNLSVRWEGKVCFFCLIDFWRDGWVGGAKCMDLDLDLGSDLGSDLRYVKQDAGGVVLSAMSGVEGVD